MKNKIDLAREWVRKAENDLKNVELILKVDDDDKPFDTVCFHCQQAAEKFLKGFLILNNIQFPKTHNIEVLLDLASSVDSSFEFRKGVLLTNYAVEIRYPDVYNKIDEQEAIEAYEIAINIKNMVLKLVKKTIFNR